MNTYLTYDDMCRKLQVSRVTLDRLVRDGVLPKPVKLSDRLIRWSETAVDKALGSSAASDALDVEARIDAYFDQKLRR